MTYSEAYQELQQIVDQLKNEEIPIDEMKSHVLKAKQLIKFCQNKLRSIENDLTEEDE